MGGPGSGRKKGSGGKGKKKLPEGYSMENGVLGRRLKDGSFQVSRFPKAVIKKNKSK